MDIKTSHLQREKENSIGQVFTPLKWAEWVIEKWGIFDAWINGASICDPTSGQGVFILALLQIAKRNGISITNERLSRLSVIEIDLSLIEDFEKRVTHKFNIEFSRLQVYNKDIITDIHDIKYDILIGNPPWVNFTDLPELYKDRIKSYFIEEGLVQDKQQILLGSSRIDIAALILKIAIGKLLNNKGCAYFYLPTSLFFGDGAHTGFRNYNANCRNFSVSEVYEFTSNSIFKGISTSYCCAKFICDTIQHFPIPYFKESNTNWVEYKAFPFMDITDPWRIAKENEDFNIGETINIKLTSKQKPRQGVNTCGANSIFIFDKKPEKLPKEFIYPLATKDVWVNDSPTPYKWIFLPYCHQIGKPLTWRQIEKYDGLADYLNKYSKTLKSRKGVMLKSYMKKGNWWSLLGVGSYSFAPYKVIWQAYGKNDFNPIILGGIDGQPWQGNQAMHAFIPCWDKADAQRIKSLLENPEIPKLLRQLNGSGKCNWAQPGKMKKILMFDEGESNIIQGNLFKQYHSNDW